MLGLVGGMVAIRAMRAIDEYGVEVGITLALATGLYALSLALDISGPIAVVVAGLMVGQDGAKKTMSEQTRRYTHAPSGPSSTTISTASCSCWSGWKWSP